MVIELFLSEKIKKILQNLFRASGAKLPYSQATVNTQIAGAEIAKLVNTLSEKLKIDTKNFHLIGHSLGYYFLACLFIFWRKICRNAAKLYYN